MIFKLKNGMIPQSFNNIFTAFSSAQYCTIFVSANILSSLAKTLKTFLIDGVISQLFPISVSVSTFFI